MSEDCFLVTNYFQVSGFLGVSANPTSIRDLLGKNESVQSNGRSENTSGGKAIMRKIYLDQGDNQGGNMYQAREAC